MQFDDYNGYNHVRGSVSLLRQDRITHWVSSTDPCPLFEVNRSCTADLALAVLPAQAGLLAAAETEPFPL